MINSDRRFGIAAVLTACLLARTAHADSSDTAHALQLFEEGRRLARDGRCAEAVKPLMESVQHAEGVGPMLNLGQCYETLGKPATAHKWFARAEALAASRNDPRQKEAAERKRVLASKLSTLTVSAPAGPPLANASVRVDGELLGADRWGVAIDVDPGAHTIETSMPGHGQRVDTVIVNANGDRVSFVVPRLDVPAPPRAPTAREPGADVEPPRSSSTQRTVGYVVGGAGALGLVGGSVFGLLSISAHSDVKAQCPAYPECDASVRGDVDGVNTRAQTFGTVSTISFIAGGALLVGGVLLVLTSR